MKSIISILLILITALYVLPVSDGFMADAETACKYIDKNTDDGKDTKKDTGKEFISFIAVAVVLNNSTATISLLSLPSAIPVHFTIEIPPPDWA